MTITTARVASPLRRSLRVDRRSVSPAVADLVRLTALGAMAAIGGAWGSALGIAMLVGAVTGSPEAIRAIVELGGSFLAVTTPVTALWLAGALGTRARCRTFAGVTDADRRAIAELHRLLEAC